MKKVLVSVIVPVYQVSDYIERCMRSIMNQQYTTIECILVDDATLDDSIAQCERLIQGYRGPIQFKILHHKENKGLSAARNTGTMEATGEYIYYLDSDDEITPDCISSLMAIAEVSPDAEMIIGNYQTLPEGEHGCLSLDLNLPSELCANDEIATAFLDRRFPMNAWGKLTKRSFLTDHHLFFKEGILYEDIHWSFFVIKYLRHIRVNKAITYHYYVRPGSIMRDAKANDVGNSFYQIYTDILNNLTAGREGQELTSYVEGLCNRYLRHRKALPEYDGLFKAYRSKAAEFGCKGALMKLRLARLLALFPFGLKALECLRALKR